jgi:hypothetical protein
MILRDHRLTRAPAVFRAMTGPGVAEFDALAADVLPRYAVAERARPGRPTRRRAIGGGRKFALPARDQLLLAVVWRRRYPTNAALGYRFGVSEYGAPRAVARRVPVRAAAGLDTRRLPAPGRGRRPARDALLAGTPGLAVRIATFEQRVPRCRARAEADTDYSGKRPQHTRKSQVAVDAVTGARADVAARVRAGAGLVKRQWRRQRVA